MKEMYITLGISLLLMVGCAKERSLAPTEESIEQISFKMEEVKAKASVITTANIVNFGVYCYNTGQGSWVESLIFGTVESNWIQNGKISRQGVEWVPDQLYKWAPANQMLTFLAYAPFASTDNGITVPQPAAGEISVKGVARLGLEIRDDVMTQVDFLVAHIETDKNSKSDERFVRFNFVHTLVKVGFRAFCSSPGTLVQSITLKGMRYKGSVLLNSVTNWTIEVPRKEFTIELGGVPLTTDPNKPTDLSGINRFFMLFPEEFTSGDVAHISVTYTSNGEQITKEVAIAENWEQGKSILYTLDLGGEETDDLIVDKVIIEDWKFGATVPVDGEALGGLYNLIYDANGGSGAPASISCKQGEMPKISSGLPVRSGYTFKGWSTKTDGSGIAYQAGTRIRVGANITLYAIWQ